VHCLYSVGPLGEQLREEGFAVTRHHSSSGLGLMRSLYREFRRSTPDVVHCHNATATVLGAISARAAGVKRIVATRHGLVMPPYQLRCELRFAVAARCCDWIVGVCRGTRTNLMNAPLAARRKIIHIYNGCLPVNPDASPRPKSGFTAVHVGRLVPEKDQATLLHAVALARRTISDLQLWIVGDGPLASDLRMLSERLGLVDCVAFFGEQVDVSPFLLAADLFVMSSIAEGVPLSLLEAMSVGVPAVVTDVGGMGECARLSKGVKIVPVSDPAAMARGLADVASRRKELPAMGELARRCYVETFGPEAMADAYMRLYQCDAPSLAWADGGL